LTYSNPKAKWTRNAPIIYKQKKLSTAATLLKSYCQFPSVGVVIIITLFFNVNASCTLIVIIKIMVLHQWATSIRNLNI